MAPQHFMVTRDMLSDYAVSLLDPDRPWKPSKKLVPNLLNKTKYAAHYRNLHVLVITKIHRFLSFTQRPWLKPWIDLCNEQRKAARSEFESDLAKPQANTAFGKTMEQVRLPDCRPEQTSKSGRKGLVPEERDHKSRLGHGAGGLDQDHFKQTNCRGIFDFFNFKIYHVLFLLPPPQGQICRSLYTFVHRYGQLVLRDPN